MNDQAQFFVGWGTLSLINAGLAQSKNRSGLLWWIASLFFGPLATFLIVILDSVGPPTVRAANLDADLRQGFDM